MIVIAYIPVIHRGYVEFLTKHQPQKIYLLGRSITSEFRPLEKDVRSLEPLVIKQLLEALLSTTQVVVLEADEAASLNATLAPEQVLMPDEEVSRAVAKKYWPDVQPHFDSIFLRWDSQKSLAPHEVNVNHTVSASDFATHMLARATDLAGRSADWWRQVGAVIAKDGQPILETYNRHVPDEQQPYYDGDPRADFHKGEHLDKATALHAEAGLIAEAAAKGISLSGSDLFVTTFPCPSCAKLVAYSGIKKVYFKEGYAMVDGESIMKARGVELIKVE